MKLFFWIAIIFASVTNCLASENNPTKQLFSSVLWDMSGKQVSLESLRGRNVVLSFWSSSCATCAEEVKDLNLIRADQKGKIEVIGISVESDLLKAREFARKTNMTYLSLVSGDLGRHMMKTMGNDIGGVPFTVVIDRTGFIVNQKIGHLKKAEFDLLLRR